MKRLFFGGIHPAYNKEMSKTVSAKKAALLPNNIESLEYGIKITKEMMVK